MKRNTPLRRDTKKSREWADKRAPINRRSKERQDFMKKERNPLIEELIEAGHKCEIGPLLIHSGLDGGRNCINRIQGIHELRKRSAGGSLVNWANLVPACNPCNGWVENNSDDAHALGLVVREGDELWDELGARNDCAPTEGSQGDR